MLIFRGFFRSLVLLIPILVLSAVAPVAAGDLPTLEQIPDRYVEALGGREAIAKLETRTINGKQIDDRPYMGPPVETALEAWAAAGSWAMVLRQDGGDHREGWDGDLNWVRDAGQPVQTNDYPNAKLAFIFNPQASLMLEKYFPNPRVTGTWKYDGKLYYKVENDLKLEYYTLYFEVETGMLTRIGYHWWLEDFRTVDGVKVPFKVMRGRKGGSTNLYFDTVTHNAEVADHLAPGGNGP